MPSNNYSIDEESGRISNTEHKLNHQYYCNTDSDDSDSDSEYSGRTVALELFVDFPDDLKTVKPLITEEDLEYGTMEIVQNPWGYIDGNDLLPSVKALLENAIRKSQTHLLMAITRSLLGSRADIPSR